MKTTETEKYRQYQQQRIRELERDIAYRQGRIDAVREMEQP